MSARHRIDLEAIRERVERRPFIERERIAAYDAPALIAEVERLRDEVKELREALMQAFRTSHQARMAAIEADEAIAGITEPARKAASAEWMAEQARALEGLEL